MSTRNWLAVAAWMVGLASCSRGGGGTYSGQATLSNIGPGAASIRDDSFSVSLTPSAGGQGAPTAPVVAELRGRSIKNPCKVLLQPLPGTPDSLHATDFEPTTSAQPDGCNIRVPSGLGEYGVSASYGLRGVVERKDDALKLVLTFHPCPTCDAAARLEFAGER